MPDLTYVAAALTVAVGITVALRATPFLAKAKLQGSPLLADLGRWMPLGAVAILAIYCVSRTPATAGAVAGTSAGIVVTIAVHAWRRNGALSIVAGTAACMLLSALLG